MPVSADESTWKWKPYQRYRLAIEQRILQQRMPDFTFHDPHGDTYVSGRWTSSRGARYGLMVTLPPAFPDEPPACYITDPIPLPSKEGNLDELTYNSHEMHCWIPDKPGYVKICTYKPENWSADHSIEKVIQKALLWIEAYESHLVTGKPISKFLMDVTY